MIRNRIIYTDFSNWKFNVQKALGSYIWTSDNRKLIDFTSGWNVTNLGWNHPEITQVIIEQARKNTYAPMWATDKIQEEYAEFLTNSLPKELNAAGRATGGTEANEEAIKTARAFTERKKIIGFKNTYHGQSYSTMSIGYLPEDVKDISPMLEGFIQIDFPKTSGDKQTPQKILKDFESELERLLSNKDVAAIITEAGIITGWGSTYVAPSGYLEVIRRLTKKYGTLLILDEVGTGFSRCGKLFGLEIESVIPDIVTLAKGMSNGACAIGAMVTTQEIAEKTFAKTNLTSTFGWTPVACAASLKTLEIHKRDSVWEKANTDGKYMKESLKKNLFKAGLVDDVRGVGMEIGITVKGSKKGNNGAQVAKKVVEEAFKKGLHLIIGDGANIQLMPPLTIERKDLDKGLEILIDIIKNVQ